MVPVELDQDGGDWLEWRQTGIGSSDAPSVLDVSPWKSRRELWEEKTLRYHQYQTKHIKDLDEEKAQRVREAIQKRENQNQSAKRRGKLLEPRAREYYESFMGFPVPAACGHHPDHLWLKVSLDGWHEELRLFVEIKAPNRQAHEQALAGHIPHYYLPQVYHQFLATGGDTCHYVSFHDKFPAHEQLKVVPVKREDVQQELDDLLALEHAFWDCVVAGEFHF